VFPAFLIQIVVVLLVVGLILWAVTQIPMDATIARIIRVVVIVCVVIWLLYVLLGIAGTGPVFQRRASLNTENTERIARPLDFLYPSAYCRECARPVRGDTIACPACGAGNPVPIARRM
jgi:hypothetical protein